MFTNRLLKMFYYIFHLGRYFGSNMIMLNLKTKKYYLDSDAVQNVNRNFIAAVTWDILALLLVLKYYFSPNSLNEFNLALSWWLGFTLLIIVFTMSRFYNPELCDAGNGLTNILNDIQEKYMPSFNPKKSSGRFLFLDIVMALYCYGCFLLCILSIMLLLYDPRGAIFLGGLIPLDYFCPPVAMIVIIFHVKMLIVVCSNLAIVGSEIFVFAFYIYLIVASELRLGKPKYLLGNEFRSSKNIRFFHRAFQIAHQHCFICCRLGFYTLAVNAFIMASAIYLTFVLFRYWVVLKFISKAPMLIGDFLAIVYWTVILQMGCMFYVRGSKTLGSWKRYDWGSKEENRLMKMFRLSCKLMLISYGKQFVVGRMNVLSFFLGVTKGTFRALLTLK